MATLAFCLYVVAGLLLVGAFAAHVARTTLLAGGRRLAAAARIRQPAFAGVVTGSFVAELDAGPSDVTPRSAAGPFAIGIAWSAVAVLGVSLLVRGLAVGRGPWGNLYEFVSRRSRTRRSSRSTWAWR